MTYHCSAHDSTLFYAKDQMLQWGTCEFVNKDGKACLANGLVTRVPERDGVLSLADDLA